MFIQSTYDSSDRRGKQLVAEFLRQLGFQPTIYKEAYKDGDMEAFMPALGRAVIFGAEYRGTETEDLTKYPWQPGDESHPWRFIRVTVHIPGRKSPYERTEVEISIDSKTELNLTVLLLKDATNPSTQKTESRGDDNLTDVALVKCLVFHRATKQSPWVMCTTCGYPGDDGDPDSISRAYLKKMLGLSIS